MNLRFVRQAIYQQKREQPLEAAAQEEWVPAVSSTDLAAAEPSAAARSSAAAEPGESMPPPARAFVEEDLTDFVSVVVAEPESSGVEIRSALIDSRESRLAEKKALKEFKELQSEARVVQQPDAIALEKRGGVQAGAPAVPLSRERPVARALGISLEPLSGRPPPESSAARSNFLGGYESGDSA